MKKPRCLYRIVAGVLPIERRFVLLRFQDGSTWLVRGSVAVDRVTEYNWRHREEIADGDSDQEHAETVVRKRTMKDWREYAVLNEGLAEAVLEERWSDVCAVHLQGPKSTVPSNDRCWWIDENGGEVVEVTDLPPSKQRRIAWHWRDRRPGHTQDGAGRCEQTTPVWKRKGSNGSQQR